MIKKRILAIILTVAMVTMLSPVIALAGISPAEEALGTTRASVTSGSIYTISSQEELAYLSTLVENGNSCLGATFVLTTNITITNDYDSTTDGNWHPIGYANNFAGTFDGQGFTVSGINVQIYSTSGFFSTADSNAIIRNVNVSGTVSGSGVNKGGIVGVNNGIVQNCYSSVTINTGGTISIGGVVGTNNGTVQNCYNSGSVIGNQYIGGIVGHNTGTVQNCYNTGNVSGVFHVGGIIGCNSNSGIVQNCYNTGNVTGSGYIGGVVGTNDGLNPVQNCYWLSSSATAGINGGTGTNVVNFASTSGGTLTTAVGGETSLLAVLNAGVATFQTTPAELKAWVVGTTYPVFKASTEAPAFSNVTYSMPNSTATSLSFTLTNAVSGATYRLYSTRLSGSAIDPVTSLSGTTLSFMLPSAPTSDTKYYISAEDVSGSLPESLRTQVTVVAFVPPVPPAITTTTLSNGNMGTAYTQTLTATGDIPVTWSLSSGSLPTGLSLSSDGTISGTPTTAGNFNFTVKAENVAGNDTLALSIEISATPITGIPQSYTIYTGGRVTWDPTPSGGTWDWDHAFFSATFNSPATFTALQTGTSTITYTVNGVVKSVTITVLAANIPQAGQNSTMFEMLASLAVLCTTAAGALYLTDRKNKNNDAKS